MAKGTEGYKLRTITCERCGETVTKRMPAGRRFCSLTCYRAAPKPERKTGETRSCERCGAEFYVPRSRVGKDEGRFCSLACHNANQGRGKTEHTCLTCGEVFRWSLDRSQDAYVWACGWEVVRFWESDLRATPGECAERLKHLAHRPLGDVPSRDPLAPA